MENSHLILLVVFYLMIKTKTKSLLRSISLLEHLQWWSSTNINHKIQKVVLLDRLKGPSDVSRFDSSVTSDLKESGKTVRAVFQFPPFEFAEDSDSGEGGCDDDCTPENFVHGFNYVDPKLLLTSNVDAKLLTSPSVDQKLLTSSSVDQKLLTTSNVEKHQQQTPTSPTKVDDATVDMKNRTWRQKI